MEVKNKDDRHENPGSCDDCGYETGQLNRSQSYGPSWPVTWTCNLCYETVMGRKVDPVIAHVNRALNYVLARLSQPIPDDTESGA